ncbi:predicted protein [Naegleria gruberi]|uniref:Predicted protein n=1 Tax=Naegleria gruberi TaxID=5762 RepID=D2VYF0_NAEGR|nr:uncharacterized protein NAEGRDRAFT_74097 [Naegleria gruberi]EFC38198.1 predicted protein [Naegleria gruberi]|eukprot:XP_002670942.1 predicted protein [Naegleria gruberi strain NEG-M]
MTSLSPLNNVSISSNYVIPGNIYLDSTAGVMYTTEDAKIRKITLSSGIISTLVGSGRFGTTYTTDPTTTQMHMPKSLTLWKTHLIWIDGYVRIRKLDSSTNQVSVIFGAGNGNSDNTVTNPLLVRCGSSLSITVDPSDNIYFADFDNVMVRKIDGTTNVASVYNYYPSGLLGYPVQIKYCNGGLYVYVNDNVNFYIQKLTESDGTVYASVEVGGGSSKSTGISGTSYQMDATNYVTKMDCYNNELYWNAYDYSIRKLTTGGIVEQVLGNGYRGESEDGTITSSSIIGYIEYLTIDQANGDLYFAENNYNIRKLVGTTLSSFLHYRNVLNEGNPKTLPLVTKAIALYSDGIYLAEPNSIKFYNLTSSTIKHFAGYFYLPYNNKAPIGSLNIGGSYVTARYSSILSMTCTPTGDIYLIDNHYPGFFIKLLSKSTGLVTIVAGTASALECVNGNTPTACAITNAKNIQYYNGEVYFATDIYIYKISSSTGKIEIVLGGGTFTSDGASSSANIATLGAFTIRPSDGKIYYFQQIGFTFYLKVFSTSTVTTLFTTSSVPLVPFSLYVNDNGYVYYTDSMTNTVKLFTPTTANANTGTLTSYAGNSFGTYNDGETLANTKFTTLVGLTFSNDNNLMFVADDKLRIIYKECDANYGGDYCNLPYCYSIRSDDSTVCNSNGNCTDVNNCLCSNGFSGANCSSWTCNGYSNSLTTGCSYHGTCTSYNTCNCSSNYYGSNCSITTCNDIYSNSSEVCLGRGICAQVDDCHCEFGFTGNNCQNYNCSGIAFDNSSVCSSRGLCLSPNNCSCQSGFFGNECQHYNCYGILANSSQVCSSSGVCSSPNNCTCNDGYTGDECHLTSCYGVSSNNSKVCSGHGGCSFYNNCICESGYFGNDCFFYNCFGILNTNSSVCSGNGNCTMHDTCECKESFTGLSCNVTIPQNSPIISNISFGNITFNNTSMNETSYFNETLMSNISMTNGSSNYISLSNNTVNTTSLNDTEYFNETKMNPSNISITNSSLNYTSLNDTANFNETKMNNDSSHNSTSNTNETDVNSPLLQQNTSTINNTILNNNVSAESSQIYLLVSCFGILNTNSSVCSGNGNCSMNDTCECKESFTGLSCNVTIPQNSPIISNISFGNITFNNTSMNETSYFNETIMSNISMTNGSSNYTSENSTFTVNETDVNSSPQNTSTIINNTNPTTSNTSSVMQNSTCYGTNSTLVCSGNGKCLTNQQCSCDYGYAGDVCELNTCFGIPSSDRVCNGRGVCSNINTCECFSRIGVKIMGDECETLLCRGVYNGVGYFFSDIDSRVCSNHGKCFIDLNNSSGCFCDYGYYGDSCNKYDCFSESSTSENVCSGHGTCESPDTCQCLNDDTNGHFAGPNCNTCHSAFSGSSCKDKTCTASTCLNGGSCGNENQCVCTSNFTGLICEDCKLDHYGLNCNVYCNYETTCNGHGFCDMLNGTCLCFSSRENGYWNGTSCNSCLVDYYGSDCLTRFDSFNSTYSSALFGQISKYFDGISFKLFGPSYSHNSISCSKLIHPNDFSLFGVEPKCYWTDKLNGVFKIEFDNDFTFDITKVLSIRLNTNVFSNTLIDYGYIRMYLILSDNIQAPTANIKTSKKLYSTSENIYLSASNSFSGDKKGLEYYWSINGQNVPMNVLQSTMSTKDQILKIEKDQLTSGTFVISLFVKSQVSKLSSSTESITIQVQDVEFPSVVILNKEISVKSIDKYITIKKTTSIPISLKEKEMKIEWQQIEGPTSIKFKKDSYNNLVIEQLSIGKWKYVFKVSIFVVENPTLTSNDFVVINADQPKLSLSLSLKQSTRISNSIQVNFQDPENNLDEYERWKWTCIDVATVGYCGDTIYQNLALNSKNRSTIINLSQQDFPSYVMSPTLTLFIMKGDRSVYSSLNLNIQHSPPIISVISISPNLRNIVTNDDKISIEMKHQDQDPSNSSLVIKTQWKIDNFLVSESNTKKVNGNEFETTSSTITTPFKHLKSLNKNKYSSLVIDSKELEEGTDHSIEVKVSFVDSYTNQEMAATSNVNSFTKALPPRKCPCTISPTTGVSMKTDFTFSCDNCQNEDNTIEIKQGYIDQETGIKVYLPLSLDGSVNIPSSSSATSSTKRRLDDHSVQLFVELGDKSTGESRVMYSNITVLPPSPPHPTLSEILNLVSNQTSKIMSTSIQDGNTAVSIADTLTCIVSTSQLLQTLPSTDKETSTVTQVQSKLLDTLSSSLQTTGSDSVSSSTTSMAVLALHSVVKNEQVIEKPVIQKSITILNNVIQLTLKSKVDIFTQTSKPLLAIVGKLSDQVAKFTHLKEEFIRYEEIASTAEMITLSYVSVQPVSGDPAAIHESVVNAKADKMYLTDFSNVIISSAPTSNSKKRVNIYQSFVNIPPMKVTESNEFAELTYSYIVKEHVPSIYQKILQQESNNSTNGTRFDVISSVSASLAISSPHAHMIEFSQNLTIYIHVNDEDFSTASLTEYACVLVNSNLESDFENCTISGRDKATESIACNCRFIDLHVSNVIILKNNKQKIVLQNKQEEGLDDDVLVIIIVAIVSCVGLSILSISMVMGIFACYMKKKSKKIYPYERKELISHNIEQPTKPYDNSLISTSSISLL